MLSVGGFVELYEIIENSWGSHSLISPMLFAIGPTKLDLDDNLPLIKWLPVGIQS
jgi:hypothetical protein